MPVDTAPEYSATPRHLAVIMDGNGRWAAARGRSRGVGHRIGVLAARRLVEAAGQRGIGIVTLFAFSQENWRRPPQEVSLLMRLFARSLRREVGDLNANGVRLRFIGHRGGFPPVLQRHMAEVEQATASNDRLDLLVALGYGGQWDIVSAAEQARRDGVEITHETLSARLSTGDAPPPDLLIRTGGERRISNFMLWQLAYAELHFVDTLWPDFQVSDLDAALDWYAHRQRRFGRVPEQV